MIRRNGDRGLYRPPPEPPSMPGTVMRFKFPATRGSLILLLFEFQHMNLIGSRKGTHEMETEACRDRPKKAGAKGAPV